MAILRFWNINVDDTKPVSQYNDEELLSLIEDAQLMNGYENGAILDYHPNISYYTKLRIEVLRRMRYGIGA